MKKHTFSLASVILLALVVGFVVLRRPAQVHHETMRESSPVETEVAADQNVQPIGNAGIYSSKPAADEITQASTAVAMPPSLFKFLGATTGQPLKARSAVFTQANRKGQKLEGRATRLDRSALEVMSRLKPGDAISIPLTDQESLLATVHFVAQPAVGVFSVIGGLVGREGSFSVERDAGKIRGMILLQKEELAYRIDEDDAGGLMLREVTLGDVMCMPPKPGAQMETALKADKMTVTSDSSGATKREPTPTDPLRVSEPAPILNSRPSAVIQFYLNFNGEIVSGTQWNAQYNGGNPIVAAAAGLTAAQITSVFNEVAEYYRPFNVNVTTELARYTAAAPANRMKCVVTPTNTAGGGDAGTLGIAYTGTFGSTGVNAICWAFTHDVFETINFQGLLVPMRNGLDAVAVSIAHELGHTVGLLHDGLSPNMPISGSYFSGHGQGAVNMAPPGYEATYNSRWGPVMGSPVKNLNVTVNGAPEMVRKRADVAQWCKGEYANANNLEDDLAIIAGQLGYIPDEDGNTSGTAAVLAVTGTTVNHPGVITQQTDVDYYRFTTTGGTVTINVTSAQPTLDVFLEILNSTGGVVATANPSPSVNASIATSLGAGLYYVKVSGVGDGVAANNGYSSYGSIGAYTLTGTVNGWIDHPGYSYDLQMTNPFGGNVVKIAKQASSSSDFATITTAETGYVNFGFANFGVNSVASNSFSVGITRNGIALPSVRNNSTLPPFASISEYSFASPMGTLPVGSHKVVVTLDKDGEVNEHDETNNSATRWLNVIATSGTPADMAPIRNTGWDDRMVLSTVTGTNTDASSITSAQNLYVDFAWSNFGPTATGVGFTVTLKLDGVAKLHQASPALAALTGTSLQDYNLGKLSAGTHTVEMIVDSGFVITEGDEDNNVYSRTFAVVLAPTVPTVSSPTGSYGATSATFGGTANSDGGSPITARGILLSTSPFPSVSDPSVLKGLSAGTTGVFTGVSFAGLIPSTQYYGSVFATNAIGTNYYDFNFTTLAPAVPVIGGLTGTYGRTTASYSATVSSDSGNGITERGILLAPTATNANPQLGGTGVVKVTSAGSLGSFTCQFSSLTPNTAYSVRGFATNSSGTAYTSITTFTTPLTEPPTVISPTSTSITTTTATLGGNVTSDGGVTVSGRGIIYSPTAVNADPQYGGNGVVLVAGTGSGLGVFTVNVTGLTPGTAYSFRPYGTGSAGTGFSTAVGTFTTLSSPPVVTTPTAAGITSSSATLGGNVTANGGSTITAVGVVYAPSSVNANPQLGGVGVSQVSTAGSTGVFTRSVTGLSPNTQYSYAAFATNSLGTGYSSVGTFTSILVLPPYSLAVSVITVGANGGSDSVVLVTASPSSTWTATANDAWLHVAAGSVSGTGSGIVSFSFDANYGSTRTGTLTIGGQTLTVTQVGYEYTTVAFQPAIVASGGLNQPSSVALDVSGNVYIADTYNHAIKKWTASTQTITTLVSSGLSYPFGVAVDGFGNVYIADTLNSAVKKWTAATQTMTTLAAKTYDNYDNPALNVNTPEAVAVDAAGNVYIADTQNNMIKKWTASTQVLSTLVSTGLNGPKGVAVDAAGNVYISDTYNNALKKWSVTTQTVSTLPTSVFLYSPRSVSVDGSGNVYVASGGSGDILKWTASTQGIAQLAFPVYADGVAVDLNGNVFFTDRYYNRIEEAPRAFVNATSRTAPAAAGLDVLPVILPTTVNLKPPFLPTSNQSWLTFGTISNGVVNYAFTQNNTGASRAAQISVLGQSITVTQSFIPPPSGLTYTSNAPTYYVGLPITANSPSSSGGAIISYSVSPALPAGLTLNTSTGVISGTPSALTASASYTVTGSNGTGSTTRVLTIAVLEPLPGAPVYPVNPAIYTKGTLITANTPTSSGGGTPTSWALTGTLPAGLSFSTSTGAISGTPTALLNATSYSVTANNATGPSSATALIITVKDLPPSALTYTSSSPTYVQGVAISPNSPSSAGGAVVSYTVAPDLPDGLLLDRDTGIITGTPTTASAVNAYTVTATNSGGSTTRVLNITVTAVPPVVASVSPAFGSIVGGTSVTITGSNFTAATSVTLGGVSAFFTVVDAATITATTPAHAAGAVTVIVSTPSGSSTGGAGLFTYVTPNTAPSFTLPAGSVQVSAGSGPFSSAGFAMDISPGPANESAQDVSFTSSNNNTALFTMQPQIASDGTLTFTPGAVAGSAIVTVTASDNGGTAYGGVDTSSPQTFVIVINANAPVITTPTVSGITASSAILGGDVISDGGAVITERGVVYAATAINSDPQIGGTGVSKVTSDGTIGVFTKGLSGLSNNTSHTFKAYVTNSVGTSYTDALSFTTLGLPEIDVEQPTGSPLPAPLEAMLAWGANNAGQINVPLAAQSGAAAISAGYMHNLILLQSGAVIGWGSNNFGESTIPTAAQTGVVGISAGAYNSLALKADGSVVAWGRTGNTAIPSGAQSGVTAISAGFQHNLALKGDGSVVAWGASNSYGQTAVPIAAQAGVTAISAGMDHNLALKNGGVIAWGNNANGQCNVPATAQSGVTAISAGDYHSVALKSDGTVLVWGDNSVGQLNVPEGLTDVTAISAGRGYFTMAQKNDGTLVSWGQTSNGQTTIPVEAQSGAAAFSAGGFHGLVLKKTSPTVAFTNQLIGSSSATKSFTLKNSGTAPLVISSVSTFGGNAAEFTVNTSGMLASVPSGSLTTFSVTFTPTATGARMTTLRISNNDSDEAVFDITLSSTGLADTIPPQTVITSSVPASNSTSATITFTGTDNAVVSGFEGKLDSASYAPVTSPVLLSNLSQGAHIYSVRARDAAGNVDLTPATISWTTDTLPPVISGLPANITTAATSVNGAVVTFVNPTALDARDGPVTVTCAPASGSTFPIGETTVIATATDSSSNSSSASFTVTVQVALPIVTSPNSTIVNTSTATLGGNVTFDGGTPIIERGVVYSLTSANSNPSINGSGVTKNATTGTTGVFTLDVTGLTPGISYTFKAFATNSVGTIYTNSASFMIAGGSFNAASDVLMTAASYNATGQPLSLVLNFAPAPGTNLTVLRNTGPAFITGQFIDVANGATVNLTFGGVTYPFIAWYYGGTSGRDLVLLWPYTGLAAWGQGGSGQLGDGSNTQRNAPVAVNRGGVLAGKTIVQVARGQSFTLALTSEGKVYAWGLNSVGQLGDGTTTSRSLPVEVTTTTGALAGKFVVGIAAGGTHSLAVCSDGTVAAWGNNFSGQLGVNEVQAVIPDVSVPMAVNTASGTSALFGKSVTAVAAGSVHSYALCSDGTVAAWGINSASNLGDGTTTLRIAPVAVSITTALAGKIVTAIAAGNAGGLALCLDGTLVAWGGNAGQVGDNTTITRSRPVAVNTTSGLSALHGKTVTAIAMGQVHSLAVCSDGSLAAWGSNTDGRLGIGAEPAAVPNVLVPTAVNGGALSGKVVKAVAAGSTHTVALCSDGTLAAWGNGTSGQLGDNLLTSSNAPIWVSTASGTSAIAGRNISSLSVSDQAGFAMAIYGTAEPGLPVVTAPTHANVTDGGASLGGTVASDGDATVTERGVVFAKSSENADPLIGGTGVTHAVANGTTGSFTVNASSLNPGTYYSFKAYATNAVGTSYSNVAVLQTVFDVNANLSGLTLTGVTLSPVFSSNTLNYTATVPHSTTSMAFTATRASNYATVSGSSSPLSLDVGGNTLTVLVTAQDGLTIKTYTVIITRETQALSTWISANFGAATLNTAPTDDFDGDGVPNLLEFAFGMSPTDGISTPLIYTGNFSTVGTLVASGGPVVGIQNMGSSVLPWALYVRRKDYVAAKLSYVVQFSNDLIFWQNNSDAPTVLSDDGVNQLVGVPYPALLSNGQAPKFFRISVNILP